MKQNTRLVPIIEALLKIQDRARLAKEPKSEMYLKAQANAIQEDLSEVIHDLQNMQAGKAYINSTYTLFSGKQWRFTLKGDNGKTIAHGEGYHNKGDVLATVQKYFPTFQVIQ